MTTPIFTAGPLIPLEDLSETSFGAVVVEDGRGRPFILKKDASHNWGLWEQVGGKLEARVVPIPGGKDEPDASVLIYDNLIRIYLASRLEDGARPVQMCEVTAPGVRRQPSLAHVDAIYQKIKAEVAALTARMEALTARLGAMEERMEQAGVVLRGDG